MDKNKILEAIARRIARCRQCKEGTHGMPVAGEGNADARVVFVGEAPGKTEAESGRPFVGRSGKLLRGLIAEAGLLEADVFITSPVKYLPDRGTPTPAQIAHGKTHLDKQLSVIEPDIIVLLGRVAVEGVLGEKIAVLRRHGTIVEKEGKKFFLTLHPAAAVRFVKFKKLLLEDFKKLRLLVS